MDSVLTKSVLTSCGVCGRSLSGCEDDVIAPQESTGAKCRMACKRRDPGQSFASHLVHILHASHVVSTVEIDDVTLITTLRDRLLRLCRCDKLVSRSQSPSVRSGTSIRQSSSLPSSSHSFLKVLLPNVTSLPSSSFTRVFARFRAGLPATQGHVRPEPHEWNRGVQQLIHWSFQLRLLIVNWLCFVLFRRRPLKCALGSQGRNVVCIQLNKRPSLRSIPVHALAPFAVWRQLVTVLHKSTARNQTVSKEGLLCKHLVDIHAFHP